MKNELLLVLLILGVALLSTGCVDEEMTAGKIAEEMQKKQENIEDCSATIYSVLSFNGQTEEMKYEYVIKSPDKVKTVILLPESEAGSTTVSNGDITWVYDPSTDIVQIFDIPGMSSTTEADYADLIEHYMNQSEISFSGEEVFEGRNTYVIAVHKEEGEKGELESDMNIWFDEETWMPLKIEVTGNVGEEGDYTYVVEYQNFEVNSGISDNEFEFAIPDDAQIQVIDEYSDLFSKTPEQAQQEVNFSLLVPDYIPEGYELETIYTNIHSPDTVPGKESAYLLYSNSENTISIYEGTYDAGMKQDISVYEGIRKVSVNDTEGILSTYAGFKRLQWYSHELDIMLDANMDDAEMIKIAESMTPISSSDR
ncbi:MAG: DUF4367 domain-containing protein [Methanolobus sp.]